MKLFICYARIDQHFAIQVAEAMQACGHDIWFDDRLYIGQDWWNEILRRLYWCDGFIFLISPESSRSEYCLKELDLAIKANKYIFPILIVADTPAPTAIASLQYADMVSGMTDHVRDRLTQSIALAASGGYEAPTSVPRSSNGRGSYTAPGELTSQEIRDVNALIDRVNALMDQNKFEDAVFILQRAIEQKVESRYVNLHNLLHIADEGLQRQMDDRMALAHYRSIESLIKRGRSRQAGIEAFIAFQKDYPHIDPANLVGMIATFAAEAKTTTPLDRVRQRMNVPLLEWCPIPAGNLRLVTGKNGHTQRMSLALGNYWISKYPITNAQYQLFVDEKGYENPRWWNFSTFALQWLHENPQPKPLASKFAGSEQPRVNVTWYEAMAFSYWLSARVGLRVTLPLRQQWQRAARGDDERTFPTGDTFEPSLHGNTSESKIRQTTDVRLYKDGVSPFGVWDMAGNVWQWCLNYAYDDVDITTDKPRALQGGSWFGTHERAAIQFPFPLEPFKLGAMIGFRVACQQVLS